MEMIDFAGFEKRNVGFRLGIIVSMILLLVGAFNVQTLLAKDIGVTLSWDANQKDPSFDGVNKPWQNLYIYDRLEGAQYDLLDPFAVVPQSYGEDNLSTPTEYSGTVNVPDGERTTFYFMIRSSYEDLFSVNSEEVTFTADLTPLPAPTGFVGVFNQTSKSIDFTWDVDNSGRVINWKVYAGDTEGGPYPNELATIQAGETAPTTSIPMGDLFPEGQSTTVYFTLVAFAKFDIFSPNAGEVPITVDRRLPAPVVNFRLVLK